MLAALLLVAATFAQSPEPEPEVALRVSVLPGVGLGAHPEAHVDGLAVGVISRASSLTGADVELAVAIVDGPVRGLQSALGVAVAGEIEGAQLSLGVNVASEVRGVQGTTGINWVRGDVGWAQLSAGVNVAGGTMSGVQAAAGLNVAAGVRGVQAAPLNVGGDVRGVQLGLVNVGRDVRGLQLGLVNVAKTSDVSIAPLNFVADGLHRVDVWTSDSAIASVAAKFGSRHVYTLIGVGWVNPEQAWWTFGGGWGVHVPAGPLWIEIDDSVWGLARGNVVAAGLHNKLRAQLGLDLTRHLAPFVGASINTWVGEGSTSPRVVGLPSSRAEEGRIVTWPGFHAGISF